MLQIARTKWGRRKPYLDSFDLLSSPPCKSHTIRWVESLQPLLRIQNTALHKMIIYLQIFWALGCIAWNLYGLWLIQQGLRPIGPTATLTAAAICLLFLVLFWVFRSKGLAKPYIILSAIAGTMAIYAAFGGITGDPALWPSESWRYAGILLNGMGGLACIWAIVETARKTN